MAPKPSCGLHRKDPAEYFKRSYTLWNSKSFFHRFYDPTGSSPSYQHALDDAKNITKSCDYICYTPKQQKAAERLIQECRSQIQTLKRQRESETKSTTTYNASIQYLSTGNNAKNYYVPPSKQSVKRQKVVATNVDKNIVDQDEIGNEPGTDELQQSLDGIEVIEAESDADSQQSLDDVWVDETERDTDSEQTLDEVGTVEAENNIDASGIDELSQLPSSTRMASFLANLEPTALLRSGIVRVDRDEIREALGKNLEHILACFRKPTVEPKLHLFFDKISQIADIVNKDMARQRLQAVSSEVLSPVGQWTELGESTQRWLSSALNTLLDRWYHQDLLTVDKGEWWYTCAIWAPIFDNGIRAISSDIGVNRGETTDLATAARYNEGRTLEQETRVLPGKRQDGIVHLIGGAELGAHEATLREHDYDTKILNDSLKLYRTLKDMLWQLEFVVRRYQPLVEKLSVIGILTSPKECTIMQMSPREGLAFVQESVYSIPTSHGCIGEYRDLLQAVREIAQVAENTKKVLHSPRSHLSSEQRREFETLRDKSKWPPQTIGPCKPTPKKPPANKQKKSTRTRV
ncbi:MAG: hypothetical protein M1821_007790 [Bathelium mastoideum]|nr:MAG: hypothetical protein M1821_007790 [Bathelium mastoideum]